MIYALGTPGTPVRIYIDATSTLGAHQQIKAGEVCIEVAAKADGAKIAIDGKTVLVAPNG